MSSAAPSSVATPKATDAILEAIVGSANQDATFSLALSQDQKNIRDWVHGISASTISKTELARGEPRLSRILILCDGLDVSPDALIGGLPVP
jgi:hypothetical protein